MITIARQQVVHVLWALIDSVDESQRGRSFGVGVLRPSEVVLVAGM